MTLNENSNPALKRAQQWYAQHGCVFLLGKIGQQIGMPYDSDTFGSTNGRWAETTAWRIIGTGSDEDLRSQYEFLHGHSDDFSGAFNGEQVYKLEAAD